MNEIRQNENFNRWYSKHIDSVLDIAMVGCHPDASEDAPDEFMASCDAAADRAYNLACLREKKTRTGFLPLTLAEYVHKIAEEITLSQNLIPSLTGLPDLRNITLENTELITKFAKNIGMSLREILLYVRLGFASSKGMGSSHLIFARQRGASPEMYSPDAIEKQLDIVEREYDPRDEDELLAIVDLINGCYGLEE